MTNEEKARELDKKFREAMFSPKEYHFTDCLLEMAQWKDEQVAEKCKYFLDHTCFGGYYNRQGILDVTKLFDDLIKFIKQEE